MGYSLTFFDCCYFYREIFLVVSNVRSFGRCLASTMKNAFNLNGKIEKDQRFRFNDNIICEVFVTVQGGSRRVHGN